VPGEEGQSYAEILFIWSSAFFIFAAAEACHLTGIIANLFAGILFGLYGRKNLSEMGQKLTDEYLGLSAFAADSAVFILCGTSAAMLQSMKGFVFGMIAVVLCLLGRMVSVAPLGAIVNAMKRYQGEDTTSLSFRHLVMMWHGGLRGGIALMLALEINGEWCQHKAIIVNGTFTVICVLLLLLGGSTQPMLSYMEIDMNVKHGNPDGSLVVPDKWYVNAFGGVNMACMKALVGLNSEQDETQRQNP
jgi:sodium/hydrogen exchanger 8